MNVVRIERNKARKRKAGEGAEVERDLSELPSETNDNI